MSFDVRPITDHIDQYVSLAGEALLASDASIWKTYLQRIGLKNVRGVFQAEELLGGLAFYRMGQWFGGQVMDCAGISGVAISPAARGSGACGEMLRQLLRELHDEGIPLASLYASTQRLYRTVGFEQAGGQWQYSIPIQSLKAFPRELPVHRFADPPMDALNHVAGQRGQMGNGHLRRTDGLWQRLITPYDTRASFTYLIGDRSNPEGYVIVKPCTRDGGCPQALVSTDAAALTPAAWKRLVTLVHDHRSMNDVFKWFGGPNDPLLMFADEQEVKIEDHIRWMLRIVDLKAALQRRGYPAACSGELHFHIQDDLLPDNGGRWVLRLVQGRASVERGGDGHLKMNVSVLAPLFSAFYSASQLTNLGLIESSNSQQLALADETFAGPTPWLTELF